VLVRTTGSSTAQISSIFEEGVGADKIINFRQLIRSVVVADPLQDVIVRIITALTPTSQFATKRTAKYVRFGPGPRGAQSLMLLAKAFALINGRMNLSFEDVKSALVPTLRHRLMLHFQAEADGVSADHILEEIKNAK
jgi:MoxR-like ATPase